MGLIDDLQSGSSPIGSALPADNGRGDSVEADHSDQEAVT